MDSRIGATAAQGRIDAVLFDFSSNPVSPGTERLVGAPFHRPRRNGVRHRHPNRADAPDDRTGRAHRRRRRSRSACVGEPRPRSRAASPRVCQHAGQLGRPARAVGGFVFPSDRSDAVDAVPGCRCNPRAADRAQHPLAVVSNIAFDVRPAFSARGWADLVDEFVLSFEIGATKPDPRIFRLACDRLGVDPQHCLMVGDSDEADGGARAIGCAFALVEPTETAVRTHGLLDALAANSIT